ncbi:hypothetical protein C8R45DRAFT_1039771 [Mycena sanguinolenta]|nr:hypothetical protein C8R45DRAFT_1039771 [Mycena sanguinolenta]
MSQTRTNSCPDHLASLLTRSLPPLQLLHVQGLIGRLDDLYESLRLVPFLTDLNYAEIQRGNRPTLCFKAIGLGPTSRSSSAPPKPPYSCELPLKVNYDVVVSALAFRGAALRSFELFPPFSKPEHYITAALKEFAEDHAYGTHVYIGSRKHNYII